MRTYELWIYRPPNGIAIKCLICGYTSHNPNDVIHRFCGFCHRFHDDAGGEVERAPVRVIGEPLIRDAP